MPGGDAIGLRGIDFHVAGLRTMGATVELTDGTIRATARDGLRGADILLPQPSVGATENLLLAAVAAAGTTTIRNAAREPEIADLATCLIAMGARIAGLGTHVLTIAGGAQLGGAVHAVLPDRIEFGTLACAAALTDGELLLARGRIDLLGTAAASFGAAGVDLRETEDGVIARRAKDGLIGVDLTTAPYPGFATDLQAQFMALMTLADGESVIRETIFENRFMHAPELMRLGADISVQGGEARVRGVAALEGAQVMATDLRASVSLVIAGLAARGETVVNRVYHLDRGFERLEEKLSACGAQIRRLKGDGVEEEVE
jgi:UDP-N-acetylglucosamine 1-carboxyvinyltransferase